jgi:hypothetical protein
MHGSAVPLQRSTGPCLDVRQKIRADAGTDGNEEQPGLHLSALAARPIGTVNRF